MFVVMVFFFSYLFTLISAATLTNYEVYQENNDYPRPVLLSDNCVLATSGKSPGYFVKYNQNAEVIIPSKQMFAYDSNAAIKQLKGNDNRYVVVSGRNVNYSITIFDDDINYKTTTTTHRTDSYKIDLLPLKDGSINIGWTDGQVDKRGGIVYIAKYTLNSDDTFTEQKIASWGTDNYYISCIEMNNNDLVCQYISYKCKEEYKVFDSDYTFKNGNGIWDSKDCGFDKVIKLDGEYLAFSFLMGSTFKVRVYEHFSDGTIAPKFNELVDIMSNCEVNTIKTDISHFSGNKFIGTCIKNYTTDIPSAQVAIAEYFPGENVIRSYTIQSSGTYANYPFATKFGDDFISIFYNIKNVGNVFEILEMPNCQGFSIEMFAGQTSSSFSMEKDKYVIKGSGDSNDTLNVIYLELPSEGVVYFQDNNTAIESNKVYAIQNLYYVAPSVAGTYTLKFAGVNHDNKLGKWCSVTITVKACYPGCKSCNEYGNENDNKCINGCLTDQGYYPILKITESKCAKDLQNYYVNQVEGGWKPCHDNCATCSKDFTATEENCDTCKSDKYKIDGDTSGKCTNTITDGYYLDTTGSVSIIKKCYKTCGKCSNGGTDDDNKCTECLSTTFTFEDIEGKCDSTNTSPNKNYYLDTTVSPNKWMKCHSTCATCSTGGSGSAHNCLTCISGYKKKEGTTDCVNTLPPYYYETDTEYKKCDPSCATCHGAPFTSPSANTNCITCRTDLDYYPYDTTDTVKNCVKSVPSGYYKDTTTTPPSYKKCNDACLECNGAATDTTTNCVIGKCADTYYGVDGLLTNCLKNPPLYYFKDTSVTPNIYKQCHGECLTCSGVGDSSDFKCIACKVNGQNGYTGNTGHKIENTNNCYYSTPDYYFLDSDNVYKKCYDSCLSCIGVGNANEHRCDSCKDSTYKKIYETSNCVTSTPEYYYDAGDKYKPCYSTCATCNGDGTEDDNNCTKCRGENKFKYPTKNCISSQPDHYYLEGDSYKKCDDSCDTCSGGTADDCTKCFYDNGYYPISVSGTPPTTFRCYNTKPDNTYYLDTVNKVYSKCYSTCASCSQGGDDTDNHCDSCDNTTYFPLFEKQSNCASNPPHYYKDGNYYKKCFTNCDTCSIGGDETNNNCLTCLSGTQSFDKGDGTFNCKTECLYNQKYFEGICQYCPNETAVEGNFCINCKSESKYKLEDSIECTSTSCIENPCDVSVPDGYYKVNDNFNYYKKCDPNCKTCSGSSTTCTSCDTLTSILYNSHCYSSCPDVDSKQLYRLDNSCVPTCPEEYIVDEANHQCLSCLPNYKKKGDNTRCYTSSELPEGYFIIDTTNKIFDMCYSTCKECSAISTDENNQKCTSCKDKYFLELLPSTNCKDSCGPFLVADSASHKCVNCKKENPPQYKDLGDNTKCVDSQPSNSVMKNETTNTFELCHSNCATCSKVGTDNDQQCDMCKELSYKEYGTKNCISTCTEKYYQDEDKRECVNCLKERGQYKFEDENQCTSNDSNSYPIYNETGLIGRCFASCETCNGAGSESNHNCKSCKSGFYLNGTNCTDSCPNTLVKGHDGKCVSCRVSDTEGFKYLDEEICYQSLPEGAYVIDKVNNIIAKCFDSCLECDEVGDETNHKCKKCKSEFNLQFDTENCETGCQPNYAVEDNECISCASKDLFHIVGEVSCIDSIEHTYPVDPTTNTFGRCHAWCDTCSTGGDDTNNNCDTCLAPYYKENKDSSQCTDTCDSKLVADGGSRTCINCKTHIENKEQYLNPDTHQCVENIPDGYYVSDDTYNVLAKCHPNCATCSTGPNGYDQQNCLTCTGDRYMQSGTTNCESFCSNPYAKDDSNLNDQKCILCSSIGKVKYENQDRCIDRPDNTYFSEKNNGIIKDCDQTCSSCSSAVKCDTCRVGYIFHPKDDTICIEKCSNLWYINDSNEYQCESGSSCDTVIDRTFLDENTKQCVKSCSSSDCIGCSNLYQYQKKCVSSCPSGFIVNMLTKKCEEEPEDGDNCKVIFSTSYKNNKSQLPSMAVQRANSYINRYSASSMNNVDIIKTAAFTFHLFKSDECEYETSNNYSLSYVNFTDCKLKIMAANSSIANENILFIKVDLNQTGDTNQVVYDAYNIITKKFIDLSICNDIVVNYPLTNKVRLGSAEKMLLQGIDVYNSSDPFFNDFCYPFYSEDGKDVLMKNRRSDYYIENSLCEDGCNYTKINFKSGMVECDCEHQSNKGLDTVNSILEKVPIDGFGDSLSTSNLFVVRCYNLVFDFKYMKKNIGCWLMLLLFFFQIPPMITFLFAGMNSLYSYLNQVSNQKQIDLMKEKEEQNEEEEEDDEEDEENDGSSMPSNPPKKKSTNNNVTDEEYGTPAKLMEKVPGKKLTMLDLNQKNNYVDKYSDSTKKIMNTDYMHVQKTSMNSNFTDTNNPNTGENENSKPDDYEQDDYDEMVYENAIQYDNRSICKFFIHAMSMKIVFLAPCSNISIYEPFCVKIVAFFLNIATYLVMNAILFDESYIEKRYNETGSTGFVYMIKNEIPKCIYASLASTVIGFLIMYLTNAKKRFKVAIETQKDPTQFIARTKKIISQLKCKIIGFFITSIILMGLFWYYISAFCAVYQKTQVPWLEGCLITFVFCVILQIIYALLITMFRYMGLKCKISCCYTLSTYLL